MLLPDVSRHLRAGNHAAVMDSQNRSLEFAHAADGAGRGGAGAWCRSRSSRGCSSAAHSRPADTPATADALAIFALGLPSFVMIKVFSPAYFAREDTATPMRYAALSLTANTLGSIALFFLFRELGLMPHLGIAVATTLGGWLNAGLLYATLVEARDFATDARLQRALPLILLPSLAMGAGLWSRGRRLEPWFGAAHGFARAMLGARRADGAGLAVYAVAVLASGITRLCGSCAASSAHAARGAERAGPCAGASAHAITRADPQDTT